MRFHSAWPMATYSTISSHFPRALSLGLRLVEDKGPGGVEVPLVYIAHGSADNVLPIASTSRIFVSSLRKNGYTVEFREFSGGHHLSRQVADQAMSWLTTAFHHHRSGKIDKRHS